MKLDLLYEIDAPMPWDEGPHPYGQRKREQRDVTPRQTSREDHPRRNEHERRGRAEVAAEKNQPREKREDEADRQQGAGEIVDSLFTPREK